MKILITGASGYVGNRMAHTLADMGNEVHAIVRSASAKELLQHPGIVVFRGDIQDKESLLIAMKGCGQVYHTAAMVRLWAKDPSVFYKVNVDGTRNVLDTAVETGVKKLVFTSTCGVIGPSLNQPMNEKDPRIAGFDNDYDLSKFLAEKLVAEYSKKGLFTVIASASKVYGPGIETHPLSVNNVIRRFVLGKITFCPSPENLVSNYVFIDDLIHGHILAIENGTSGEKYIIGGENLSYTEFFQTISKVSGKTGRLIRGTKNIGRLYGLCHFLYSKLLHKEPFFTAKGANHIFCNKSFSCSKAMQELGYAITPFADALQPTIHFLKQKNYA